MQKDFQVMSEAVSKAIDAWAFHPLPTRNRVPDAAGDARERRPDSGGTADNNTRQSQLDDGRTEVHTGQGVGLSAGVLHKILIQAYLKPGVGGEVPPLQIRRTLDHYFYSHLASTSRRDGDQVVQRYTSDFVDMEPKMFMVDQLWLWVLDDGKWG